MTKKTRNWSIAAGIVAFPFVLFLGFLIFMEVEPLPPISPLPSQNGYNDLVNAGQMLTNFTGDYDSSNLRQLQTIVEDNSNALQLARDGLQKQCAVPIQFSESYISNHLNDLTGIKRLAQAFVAEGKLAEMENRPGNAVESYLDTFHLGSESMRGGVLIDGLVGIAVESMAASHLTNLANQLNAKSSRETATILENLDSQSSTWNEIMQQENAWSPRTFRGWRYDLMQLKMDKSLEKAFQKAGQKFKAHQQQTQRLIIDLAVHAYKLDKGKAPTSVSDLVPDYLKTIPQDSLTGTNMVYLPK